VTVTLTGNVSLTRQTADLSEPTSTIAGAPQTLTILRRQSHALCYGPATRRNVVFQSDAVRPRPCSPLTIHQRSQRDFQSTRRQAGALVQNRRQRENHDTNGGTITGDLDMANEQRRSFCAWEPWPVTGDASLTATGAITALSTMPWLT